MTEMKTARPEGDIASLSAEFSRFQDEVSALKAKLAKLAGDTISDIQNNPGKLADLRGSIEQKLSILEDDVNEFGTYLKSQGQGMVGMVTKQVADRPMTTIAVAFGLGFVAAQLVRRKS
ncbi:MAG TPA: hypothetical protein VFN77_02535 [Acetobacteraceae bacterium]|nr:hypothetical protein [Acetobacteraceae bacterium]